MGFSLGVDITHPYLARCGIDPITAGLFGVGYYGGRGVMSGRIAIPVHDDRGRLVAYCGRALDGGAPRYRFPAGFQKSQVLFNYYRAGNQRLPGDSARTVDSGVLTFSTGRQEFLSARLRKRATNSPPYPVAPTPAPGAHTGASIIEIRLTL